MKNSKFVKTLDFILRAVATVSVLALAVLGLALVGAQLVGLALGKGGWMTGASALFLKPACVTAAVTGFVSFLRTYTAPREGKGE